MRVNAVQEDSQEKLGEKKANTNLVNVVFVTESTTFSVSVKHEKPLIQT